ncbi:DUF2768 domain-containing protein [Bacillus sp. FJAT-44742]|uniref:DUF2768 domain-containing protein n=1 Tax=Bacillus sp. FJAT-44742 TaxID=2014005 RepID=UPI000C242DC6|nr:DUF2768 domain-containing protein [Bacillus sp. FJAT-44742]
MSALDNMWFSFVGLFLMFVSVAFALLAREKLSGIFRFIVLSFSFVCLMIAGLIVFLVVFRGPLADAATLL